MSSSIHCGAQTHSATSGAVVGAAPAPGRRRRGAVAGVEVEEPAVPVEAHRAEHGPCAHPTRRTGNATGRPPHLAIRAVLRPTRSVSRAARPHAPAAPGRPTGAGRERDLGQTAGATGRAAPRRAQRLAARRRARGAPMSARGRDRRRPTGPDDDGAGRIAAGRRRGASACGRREHLRPAHRRPRRRAAPLPVGDVVGVAGGGVQPRRPCAGSGPRRCAASAATRRRVRRRRPARASQSASGSAAARVVAPPDPRTVAAGRPPSRPGSQVAATRPTASPGVAPTRRSRRPHRMVGRGAELVSSRVHRGAAAARATGSVSRASASITGTRRGRRRRGAARCVLGVRVPAGRPATTRRSAAGPRARRASSTRADSASRQADPPRPAPSPSCPARRGRAAAARRSRSGAHRGAARGRAGAAGRNGASGSVTASRLRAEPAGGVPDRSARPAGSAGADAAPRSVASPPSTASPVVHPQAARSASVVAEHVLRAASCPGPLGGVGRRGDRGLHRRRPARARLRPGAASLITHVADRAVGVDHHLDQAVRATGRSPRPGAAPGRTRPAALRCAGSARSPPRSRPRRSRAPPAPSSLAVHTPARHAAATVDAAAGTHGTTASPRIPAAAAVATGDRRRWTQIGRGRDRVRVSRARGRPSSPRPRSAA